jgi:probable rRNA maturation factor
MRSIVLSNRHPRLRLDRRAVTRAIRLLDAHAAEIGVHTTAFLAGEISLAFLTDAELAQLHAQFLDDPSVTDVITFEGDPALGSAGEICVSVDAALRHFAGRQKPAGVRPRAARVSGEEFSAELTLYVVHGWLHLGGYDDLQPAKKRAMRRAEQRALALLRAHDALPRFRLAAARR